MQSYTLNRPDGALLCRVLEQHTNDAAGAILRLAWMAGLMRDEIQHLTWAQVDLLGEQLLLPDRAVPLAPELAAWLEERCPDALFIFIIPPSFEELSRRLHRRNTDSEDVIAGRLEKARQEFREIPKYDYLVINDKVSNAVEEIAAILTAAECRVPNRSHMLAQFA